RTGAPWKDLPDRYPPYQTCHRRFQHWRKAGGYFVVLSRSWQQTCRNAAALISGRHL
ncbi:transposase, partial [Desulfobulbus sp. F5]|nr:transposase [Desulfobulbus sp. F5]